jgi:CspA family cold shock protein
MKTFLVAAIAVLISSQAFAASGTVRWYNAAKGYGFIIPDGGGEDVFVHISAVERAGLKTLNAGQKIEYDVLLDPRSKKSSADHLKVK